MFESAWCLCLMQFCFTRLKCHLDQKQVVVLVWYNTRGEQNHCSSPRGSCTGAIYIYISMHGYGDFMMTARSLYDLLTISAWPIYDFAPVRSNKKSNRKAMNRNWSNQKANPALKTKAGNKYYK